MKKDLGLYIHIPFCVRKCDYCDFLSASADSLTKHRYMEALLTEIRSFEGQTGQYQVPTIFIGGGTPSCVDAVDIKKVLDTIREVFQVKPDLELSIELNPGTVDREKLLLYQAAGINRLSFGLQSTIDQELKLLGRIHTYSDFLANYKLARDLGYKNINIDLMSALPGQTPLAWETSLRSIAELKPEHISAYSLIIEEGTPFYERYGEGNSTELPEEETDRFIYKLTNTILQEYGYHRYEISNYSQEGYECRHNLSYWTGIEYLGLGLGSSSYLNSSRFRNVDSLTDYLKLCSQNDKDINKDINKQSNREETMGLDDTLNLRRDIERLDSARKMEEFMFLGLRITKGISKLQFYVRFGVTFDSIYQSVVEGLKNQGFIEEDMDWVRLTDYGTDISNIVLAEFLLDS